MNLGPVRRSISARRIAPATSYTTTSNRITLGGSRLVSGGTNTVTRTRVSPGISSSNLRSSRVVSKRTIGNTVARSQVIRATPSLRKSIVRVEKVVEAAPMSSRLSQSRYLAPQTTRVIAAPQTTRVVSTRKSTAPSQMIDTGVRVPHSGRILSGKTTHVGTERISRARALDSVSGLTRATNVIRGALPSTRGVANAVSRIELPPSQVTETVVTRLNGTSIIPRETVLELAPVSRRSIYGRSSRYIPTVRRSISTKKLALDPMRVSHVSTGSPLKARRSISLKSSRYIPAESRRMSIVRGGDGYWATNQYGQEIWVSHYAPNRNYDVDSAVDRIIKKTIN